MWESNDTLFCTEEPVLHHQHKHLGQYAADDSPVLHHVEQPSLVHAAGSDKLGVADGQQLVAACCDRLGVEHGVDGVAVQESNLAMVDPKLVGREGCKKVLAAGETVEDKWKEYSVEEGEEHEHTQAADQLAGRQLSYHCLGAHNAGCQGQRMLVHDYCQTQLHTAVLPGPGGECYDTGQVEHHLEADMPVPDVDG